MRWYLVGLVTACGPTPGTEGSGEADASTSSTSGQAPTTGVDSGTSSGAAADTGTTGEVASSGETGLDSFTTGPTDSPTNECDVWLQDCPPGEKCAAYANDDGASWNALKCVPVVDDPALPGEPCAVEGNGISGIDSCDLGGMCWDVDAEDQGICIALCTGTPDSPICAPGLTCGIFNEGVLILCFDSCDPLEQDCDPSDLCVPNQSADGFLCVLQATSEDMDVHTPCTFDGRCDPGLWCAPSESAVECDPEVDGCCEAFCDLTQPNSCPGQGQLCNPWYPEGQAPEGDEDVGFCAVP